MNITKYKVRLVFTREFLATCSGNKDLQDEFVRSKAPKVTDQVEEDAALERPDLDEEVRKLSTIFMADKNGQLFVKAYMIQGFLKAKIGILKKCGMYASIKAHKKLVDDFTFVFPDWLYIKHADGSPYLKPDGNLQRPLLADTPQGKRSALANSEKIDPGAVLEFEVHVTCDIPQNLIKDVFDYGKYNGLGQWRNAGHGRFAAEVTEIK